MKQHATALIDPAAEMADDTEVGPYSVIGPHVRIGPGCRISNHVTIEGHTTIGSHNRFFPNACIGTAPQDITYRGSDTRVEIGDHNLIREGVTINRASEKFEGVTVVGSHNFLMACCHVAHDCILEDHITMGNGALLGGHVRVQSYANVSGAVGVHHFATIGRYSFVGGLSRIVHDVPPFMIVEGHPSRVRCVNVVGLKRHSFTQEQLDALSEAHRLVYRAKMGRVHATEILRSRDQFTPEVKLLMDFIADQDQGRFGRSRERLRMKD